MALDASGAAGGGHLHRRRHAASSRAASASSSLIGAGTWADGEVAVSCTGIGEYFIRTAAAAQLAFRLRFAGQGLDEAAAAVLAEIGRRWAAKAA